MRSNWRRFEDFKVAYRTNAVDSIRMQIFRHSVITFASHRWIFVNVVKDFNLVSSKLVGSCSDYVSSWNEPHDLYAVCIFIWNKHAAYLFFFLLNCVRILQCILCCFAWKSTKTNSMELTLPLNHFFLNLFFFTFSFHSRSCSM